VNALDVNVRRQVLTHLAKNDVLANRNETEEEIEHRAQAALAYEIEDANVAIGIQHREELSMTDVSRLSANDHLAREQIDVLTIGREVYEEQAAQLSQLKNPSFSKLYSSEWVIIAMAFMSRVAPHYNLHNVMTEAYLRTWSDVNMGVR
jgi:hypothetical protein